MIVNQSVRSSALAVAVAPNLGSQMAYLPGVTICRFTDMYLANAKTDENNAFIIADVASTLPHTLRGIETSVVEEVPLGMLAGLDPDLERSITQVTNRAYSLFTQIHPALERVVGLAWTITLFSKSWPLGQHRCYCARQNSTGLMGNPKCTGPDAAGLVIP